MRLVNDSDGYTNNDRYSSIAVNGTCYLVIKQHIETQWIDTTVNLSCTFHPRSTTGLAPRTLQIITLKTPPTHALTFTQSLFYKFLFP